MEDSLLRLQQRTARKRSINSSNYTRRGRKRRLAKRFQREALGDLKKLNYP